MRQRQADRLKFLLATERVHRIPQDRWERLSAAEKIEELTGHSLDNCRDILSLPLRMAVESPTVMTGKTQIIRAILQAVTKVGIESGRLRAMQDEVLGQLIDDFDREEGLNPRSREQGRGAPGRGEAGTLPNGRG